MRSPKSSSRSQRWSSATVAARGGGFELGGTADPEDGLLDVLVVRQAPLPALAVIAGKARTGSLHDDDLIERRTGRVMRVRVRDRALGATLDGEPARDANEFSVKVLPGAQPVWVGPSYVRSPFESALKD